MTDLGIGTRDRQAEFVKRVNGSLGKWRVLQMTEAEMIKAQADLISAQQNFIAMLSNTSIPAKETIPHIAESKVERSMENQKEITLSEYTQTFLESKKSTVKPSTYHSYYWMLEKTILPTLGDVALCRIDNRCLQNFADELLKTFSKKSVRDMVGLVKTILTDACINEVIEAKKFMIKYPKSENNDYEILSEVDFKKFEEYLLLHENPHDIGELLLLETGMRIGEMCGLKWENVNFDDRTIKIRRTVQRVYKAESKTSEINIGSTKTSAGERTVPITEKIRDYLKEHKKDGNIYVASGREIPTEPRTHRQYHKRLMRRIGIDYIKPHGLRHTFATRAIQHGVDPKTVSAILGHSNSNITLNIYTSVTEDMLRSGIDKMDG